MLTQNQWHAKTHPEASTVAERNPYLLTHGQCLIAGSANTACLISEVQTACLWKENQKPDV